ncbi:hypothetical protein Bca4012_064377 [Brassica carinata]
MVSAFHRHVAQETERRCLKSPADESVFCWAPVQYEKPGEEAMLRDPPLFHTV